MPSPYAPPRTRMGIGKLPLPGDENPFVSSTQQQRFQSAGLQSFLPYVSPFETVARARNYQNMERDMDRQDRMYDAEQGFMDAVRQDPQTGYQRFLQQNPMATMSPMVRAYLVSQKQFQPQEDKYAQNVAEMGTPYLKTYQQGRGAGKSDLEAFAEAVSQRESDELKRRTTRVPDERLNLSGPPKDALDSLMMEYGTAMEKAMRNPSDPEKQALLAETGGDWTKAFHLAKQRAQSELSAAQNKVQQFQSTYGQMYQLPGVQGPVLPQQQAAPQLPATSPWPAEAPTTIGAPAMPPQMAAPQNAPTSISIPPIQTPSSATSGSRAPTESEQPQSQSFPFPTISGGAKTPTQQALSGANAAISNIKSNISFDPLAAVAAATTPGGVQQMAMIAPPTQDEQNKAWTEAKQKVRSFIEKLPGSPEEKVAYLGSMAAEESVPMDFFTKKKAQGNKAFISTASALEDAMMEAFPDLPKAALKDKDGVREWKDVARMVALEELENLGFITRKQQAAPQASPKIPNIKSITKIN